MALETVLLHPLITKSGTKQKQNKESETKRQQESISKQRFHATRATTCKIRKNCKQKRENKHDQAHLMALETVLLHPLITKSGTKQKQNKESETKDSKSRLANSAIMQLVQQHEDTEELQAEKEKTNNGQRTPDGVGDGVAASIDHKERHKTRTQQREQTKDSKSRSANSAIMQLVQQHERYGRIATRKEKPNTTKHT